MVLGGGILRKTTSTIIAFDSFDRSDDAYSLGTSDTGQAWQVISGTFGISSNQACEKLPIVPNAIAVLSTTYSDVKVSATIGASGGISPCLCFRLTDVSNWLRAGYDQTAATLVIQKYVAGTLTVLNSVSNTVSAGDVFQVIAKGSSIQLLKNGTVVCSATDTFNQTSTMHGLASINGGTALRWDNFKIEKV